MLRDNLPLITTTRIPTTASPFSRLAVAYAIGVCGDVFVTVALADSVFFSAPSHAARGKVLLYLALTMAPFAVIAPVLGPLLDRTRGGRRLVIALACAGRAVLCLFMANNIHGLLLYPLAFGLLVLSKAQAIAKSSLVPSVVDDESELVLANSRLALIAVIGGVVGGLPAAAILKLAGGEWVLRVASLVLLTGAFAALRIPRAKHVGPTESVEDRQALHVPSIIVAGSAMGLLRGVVGFVTFFAAFVLKGTRTPTPAWVYGALLGASALGNGAGTLSAPFLRKHFREESILIGSLLFPGVVLIFLARSYGRTELICAGFLIAFGAAVGRLAFDSLVQRDAADAARGRAFARFETRFQLAWVAGGVLAVLFPGGGRAGIFLAALVLLFSGLTYFGAVRRPGGVVAPAERDWRGGMNRVLANRRARRSARPKPAPRVPSPPAPVPSATDEPPSEAFPSGS
ncbi:MAG: Major Facilitator Superfamily transporter [Actinomycetia bacterium]|nr:Major Facilitator Superfamily transporter [Actinomycetes bacterium]